MPDVRGTRAMLNRACGLYGNIPKDEDEKAAALCTKTRKNAVASPLKAIFPPGEGAPRKKRNNFSFRFFASLFCVHHDSFFTIKIYFNYASCSFSQKIMLFQ